MTAGTAAEITVREAQSSDANALKQMGETLLTETDFFHRLPAERASSVQEMETVLTTIANAPGCALVNAWHGDVPVGECILIRGQLTRLRHTATVGIGVLAAYQGLGIGKALMANVMGRARMAGITRLELTVMVDNAPAIAFYEGLDFKTEGQKKGSVMVDDRPVDEFLMALQLD